MFRRQIARRLQHLREKLPDALRGLQCLAVKVYLEKLNEISIHLVLRGIFEGFSNSQHKPYLRKSLGHAELTIATALEKALHLEAVKRIEQEKRETKVTVLQPNGIERLITSVITLLKLCLSRGICEVKTVVRSEK